MSYLVRKLNKRANIDIIGKTEDVETMFADAATAEFRSKNGTLSTWRIDSINKLDDAVLAIVVTSSKVERMDFILIDTDYLDEQQLEYSQTYAGQKIAVPDLQDTHYDIINITIPRLINCTCVYRKVFLEDKDQGIFLVRYTEGDIRDLLVKASDESRLVIDTLNNGIKKVLLN